MVLTITAMTSVSDRNSIGGRNSVGGKSSIGGGSSVGGRSSVGLLDCEQRRAADGRAFMRLIGYFGELVDEGLAPVCTTSKKSVAVSPIIRIRADDVLSPT